MLDLIDQSDVRRTAVVLERRDDQPRRPNPSRRRGKLPSWRAIPPEVMLTPSTSNSSLYLARTGTENFLLRPSARSTVFLNNG